MIEKYKDNIEKVTIPGDNNTYDIYYFVKENIK